MDIFRRKGGKGDKADQITSNMDFLLKYLLKKRIRKSLFVKDFTKIFVDKNQFQSAVFFKSKTDFPSSLQNNKLSFLTKPLFQEVLFNTVYQFSWERKEEEMLDPNLFFRYPFI